jgi:hypothetical protein
MTSTDTEQGGDILNGRWPTELLEEVLPFSCHKTPPEDLKASISFTHSFNFFMVRFF